MGHPVHVRSLGFSAGYMKADVVVIGAGALGLSTALLGGSEADPLPVDPRREAADFRTDDVPLVDHVLVERGVWQYAHYYDPVAADQR
jgi:hypothetical protein